MTKYLEFDSTYRDRNTDIYPSSFVAGISQTGQLNKTYAKDPVCDSAPIYSTLLSFIAGVGYEGIQTTNFFATIGIVRRNGNVYHLNITGVFADASFQSQADFYTGCVLRITIAGIERARRIIKYEYINETNALFTLLSPLPDGVSSNDGWIDNPSPLPTTTANSVIQFFLPSSTTIDNFYKNYYITNEIQIVPTIFTETARIQSYDGTTHLATFYNATTYDWVDFTYASAPFSIRKTLPQYKTSTINSFPPPNQPLQVILDQSANIQSFYYNGSYLLEYSSTLTTIESGRILNYIGSDVVVSSYTGTTEQGTLYFTPESSSSIDNFYQNVNILVHQPGPSGPYCLANIDVYNGETHSALISRITNPSYIALTNIVPGWWANIRSAFCVNNFGTLSGAYYEVVNYSYDNYTPFTFTGSLIQEGTRNFYEIELINLVVPNLLLQEGGIISKYPYLYVELEQVSEPSTLKYILYSNNPNSSKTLFRAVVDDVTQPLYSPFIKMDGDGMVHTVWFKPVDYFRITIKYANGTLFKTVLQDTLSPVTPDPRVQISACFAIKNIR